MLLGNSQKEETNKAIIRRLYSLLFFTLFTALYMKGRYIIMKNLKKTVKVGAFAAGVLMEVAFIIKVNKVINNMTKK